MQADTPVAEGIDIEQLYEYVAALRNGDFTVRLPVPAYGRAREVALNLNRHIENMGQVTREIARVAAECTEGKLGPQAEVALNPGPWRNMIDAVNNLAGAVTWHVRDANWTLAGLKRGDQFRKVEENCQGEWLEMKSGLNAVVEKLRQQLAGGDAKQQT